jgi:hypothetical protein
MKLLCIIYNFATAAILHTSYKGFDQHFIENNATETEVLLQIVKHIDILDKVHHLEMQYGTSKIDDKTKQILDDYLNYSDIKPANFRNGGLLTDWNFDI